MNVHDNHQPNTMYSTKNCFNEQIFPDSSEIASEQILPGNSEKPCGTKILHIGDTLSSQYSLYRKLIEYTQPDILLHTGDMADEVKIGRMPELLEEYRAKISVLLGILNESKAKLILVPGNHDREEILRELAPEAMICPTNSKIEIDGISCRIGHSPLDMEHDCPWSFYGHTLLHDTWVPEENIPGRHCRFNCMKGPWLCTTHDRHFYRFDILNFT